MQKTVGGRQENVVGVEAAMKLLDKALRMPYPENINVVPEGGRTAEIRGRLDELWKNDEAPARDVGAVVLGKAEEAASAYIREGLDPNELHPIMFDRVGKEKMGELMNSVGRGLAEHAKWTGLDVSTFLVFFNRGIEQASVAETERRLLSAVRQEAEAGGKSVRDYLVEDLGADPKQIKFRRRGQLGRFIHGVRLFEKEGVRIDPQQSYSD